MVQVYLSVNAIPLGTCEKAKACIYNEVANQDSQRRKSLKCKSVDIPVFFWRSLDNIIMVLTKTQSILILKQSILPDCSIRVIDCSIRVY